MATRTKRTAEFKFKVVLGVLKGEKQVTEIAAEFGAYPQQITNWKNRFMEQGSSIFQAPEKQRKCHLTKSERICFFSQVVFRIFRSFDSQSTCC